MSIATEFARIQGDRNTIRNKLVELGMANSTDKLDVLAGAIETLINQGAVKVEVREGETYTIPAGYHNGSGTVSGVKGGGNYTLQEKTVTPTKQQLHIASDDGYYGLSAVTVNAIPDAYQDVSSVTASAEDVLTGKVYVTKDGVVTAGEMLNNGAVTATLDVTTITYTIPKGYHSGSGKVTLTLETKTVTPTKATQEITPSSGKVLSKVTVDPIPDAYQDVSEVTATADKVLTGNKIVDSGGNVVDGTMVDHTEDGDIVPLTVERSTYTIPEGYHDGKRSVSVARGSVASVAPSKEQQTIQGSLADNGEGNLVHHKFLDKVIVEPIPDKYQDVSGVDAGQYDVLEGKKYVDKNGNLITGGMPNNGAIKKVITTENFNGACTIPEGYHNGQGTVSVDFEEKTVTPSESSQTVKPSSGKVLKQVVVDPIPENYADVTGVDAVSNTVLEGYSFVNAKGQLLPGAMKNNWDVSATIDGLNSTSVDIPLGYTTGGTISLTNDIENALKAI
jgi:hypothetical protein